METTDIKKFQNRTPEAVRVLAFLKAKPGRRAELEDILKIVTQETRKEPGNIAYVLHRSTRDPDELMLDEIWVDMNSLEDHLKTPHIQSAMPNINEMLDVPLRIETYSEVRVA
ncbi:MAG TPA: putative quinol monooxygenase [Nitrososphaera sp.]|jgi:quinol monooxygenase YgiN